MAISTEKLLTLSQFQTGLQASKNYTDAEIVKVNLEVAKKANQTALDETNGKVATLETQMGTANTNIAENLAKIDGEIARAKAAEEANATGVTEAKSAASVADGKAVKAQEEVDALEIEVAGVKGSVATNTGDISTMKGQIAALEAGTYDDTEVRGLISANEEAIGANADAIEALEGVHAEDKQALEEAIQANADAIALLAENLTTEELDSIKELVDYVAEHGTEVTGMKEDIADNAEAITALQGGKADKATTLAGYGIADAYTKVEADAKIKELIASEVVINVATNDEVTAVCSAVFGA